MYIDTLVVDEHHRRYGIGNQLMDFAISKLNQDENACCMKWSTGKKRNNAIEFYKKKFADFSGYCYGVDNKTFFGKHK